MDQVSQIREKIDIVSLIAEYVPLKKTGANFKANCPFHNEKTPSFVVSPERQIWHCFGCGKGGDCFTFLMEYENLEFVEALRLLAKRVGIELLRSAFSAGETSKKELFYKMNRQAAEFYHYVLTKHPVGKKALMHLIEERKIKPQVIETFMIGLAPSTGYALSQYLLKKKQYKKEDLISAGLSLQKRSGIADFFVNRIIFPITDHRENIVGFSGRVVGDGREQTSKYINTRETLLYHKGSVFFGLSIAKNEIKKEGKAVVMEGEFDVISSFQEGIGNAIAVKGTALTENQAHLLSRFTQKVSLCFDQDSAGQEAIKRSIPALDKKGLTVSIISLSNGKDPDESIKNDPIAFKKAVKNDMPVYDFLLTKALSSFDEKTAEGKKRISDELLPFFSAIENEIVKEHYIKKLAIELEVSFDSVQRQMQRLAKKDFGIPALATQKVKRAREEILEEYLLALIVQHETPGQMINHISVTIPEFSFTGPAYKKVFDYLTGYCKVTSIFDPKKFASSLPPELLLAFDTCYLLPLPKFQDEDMYRREIIKSVKDLQTLILRKKIKIIGEKIKEKEKSITLSKMHADSDKQFQDLQKEFRDLTSLLQRF